MGYASLESHNDLPYIFTQPFSICFHTLSLNGEMSHLYDMLCMCKNDQVHFDNQPVCQVNRCFISANFVVLLFSCGE